MRPPVAGGAQDFKKGWVSQKQGPFLRRQRWRDLRAGYSIYLEHRAPEARKVLLEGAFSLMHTLGTIAEVLSTLRASADAG